jgi:hypothetical protein
MIEIAGLQPQPIPSLQARGNATRPPSRVSRRSFLRVGSLALGGLSLPGVLHSSATQQAALGAIGNNLNILTGKTVIFLFMQGGPPQHETFDPKIDAPQAVRSVGGSIKTNVPGMHLGAPMKRIAKHADKIALIRNFYTGTQHGGLKPIVSDDTHNASLGAFYHRVVGTNNHRTGLPNALSLFPNSVDPKQPGQRNRFGLFDVTGPLGKGYAPFVPGGTGPSQENLKLNVKPNRLNDRKHLLTQLDNLRRKMDNQGSLEGLDGMRQQAFDMLVKGVGGAFDLTKEDPKTIAAYDTSHLFNPRLWGNKNNGKNGLYTANTKTLGKLLLLARRLAEAGAGFITINTEFVWDFHSDQNNVNVATGNKLVAEPFDHAVSAFIEDVEARGLSEKILLVCCGEMGRTPTLNKTGGRNHWPALAPLMLYGGGKTRGQIIGQSTRDGGKPDGESFNPSNLLSTILHTLFHFEQVRLMPGLPKEITQTFEKMEATKTIL